MKIYWHNLALCIQPEEKAEAEALTYLLKRLTFEAPSQIPGSIQQVYAGRVFLDDDEPEPVIRPNELLEGFF